MSQILVLLISIASANDSTLLDVYRKNVGISSRVSEYYADPKAKAATPEVPLYKRLLELDGETSKPEENLKAKKRINNKFRASDIFQTHKVVKWEAERRKRIRAERRRLRKLRRLQRQGLR